MSNPNRPERWHRRGVAAIMMTAALTLTALPASAQGISLDFGDTGDGSTAARVVQLIVLITVLGLAPSLLVMVTSFTRIVVVLSFIRSAIGLQQSPPNPVLVGLALFLTFFIMAPTFTVAYEQGIRPWVQEEISEEEAFTRTVAPFRQFMLHHVREKDLTLFVNMSKTKPEKPEAVELHVLIPAFMISELRRAFEIGFLIFIPFLVIDMFIASTLMSMGMMMLPPVMISLPFKVIFFVMVDGWYMVAGSLVRSYGGSF